MDENNTDRWRAESLAMPLPEREMTSADERLVKSGERVRDLGEVFTPLALVNQMLDLLPAQMWNPHPAPTYLEPSCGDGNFLVGILERKLVQADLYVAKRRNSNKRIALGLEALSSIYGIDISPENIIGGTPGHDIGARERLLAKFMGWATNPVEFEKNLENTIRACAKWIISHNVLIGNMLRLTEAGAPSGRDEIPILEYMWDLEKELVLIRKTSVSEVILEASEGTQNMLWGSKDPEDHWIGNFFELASAPIVTNPFEKASGKSALS